MTPFSLARLNSHPNNAATNPHSIKADDKLFQSSLDLMDRANSLSCSGCHARHSVAGFHLIGSNPTKELPHFYLKSPTSPGFKAQEKFRKNDFSAWQKDSEHLVQYPSFTQRDQGSYGDICSISNKYPDYGCQAGLTCNSRFLGNQNLGKGYCLPEEKGYNAAPCDSSTFHDKYFNPVKAVFQEKTTDFCGPKTVCASTKAGFPGGQCARSCMDDETSDPCIATPTLGPFSKCLSQTNDLRDCARLHNRSVKMRACKEHRDCRIDYTCVEYDDEKSFCAPPYVLPGLNLERN